MAEGRGGAMSKPGGSLLIIASMVLGALPTVARAGGDKPKEEKVEGYAEWRRDGCLLVDAQRVCVSSATKFKGEGGALRFEQIPFGYEVKAKGVRRDDGAIEASELEAKPNGAALFESDVLAATNAQEKAYLETGHMFEAADAQSVVDIGKIYTTGPMVDRVRRITGRLLPQHVEPERVRVYVVDNPEWNAMAMGNYSIYVFSGLLLDMDDDEVAMVLGHELVHASHEHTRRQFKKQMWIQLAALGFAAATENVKDQKQKEVLALLGMFGTMAWKNGYGRSLEDQADRVGLRYAYEAGYDVTKGPRLWQRFARKYGEPGKVQSFFFSDHSQSTARAANLERELALNYPEGPKQVRTTKATRVAAGREIPAAPAAQGGPPPSSAGTDFLATPSRTATGRTPISPPAGSRKEIRVGMTSDEVQALLGPPQAEIVFGAKTRWTYSDLTVAFEGGKVRDVQF
jgi:Zn-dependent protease with chaperone function